MTKAEERALENYPVEMVSGPIGYEEPKFDLNAFGRHIFQEGYEHAEKDLIDRLVEFYPILDYTFRSYMLQAFPELKGKIEHYD